jgi:adenylosuccinate lyase
VERVILPDACLLTYYVLRRATGLIDGLVVHPERMVANVTEGSFGLVFSQPVLLALVASGMSRDAAYRVVQRDARLSAEERRSFRTVLEEDPEVTLSVGDLDEAFDVHRSLRHVGRFADALKEVDA